MRRMYGITGKRKRMTFPEFEKYQEDLVKQMYAMKDTKGKEYANGASRFANFDRLAVKMEISRLKVANIFLTKHLDAIDSYINNGKTFSTESIQGRVLDAMVYLSLIGGMIFEDERGKDDGR